MGMSRSQRKADPNYKPRGLLQHANELLRGHREQTIEDYVYVPKGNVYLTRHCRDLTNQSGLTLYVVYHEANYGRLGIDCPLWIFEAVTADAVASAAQRQQAVAAKDQRDRHDAQAVLEQVFPYMPIDSLTAILDHGFEKGSGRVGRVQKLDEVVKANLAVNAHIRHNMTAYDSIYSTMKATDPSQDVRTNARIAVYDQVKEIADSWRTGIARPALAEVGNAGNLTSTVGLAAAPGTTQQDPDIAMDDVTNQANSRALFKPTIAHQKASSGVQKNRRVQPKRIARDITTLNKALESIGLQEVVKGTERKKPDRSAKDLRRWRAGNNVPIKRINDMLRFQAENLTDDEKAEFTSMREEYLQARRETRAERRLAADVTMEE